MVGSRGHAQGIAPLLLLDLSALLWRPIALVDLVRTWRWTRALYCSLLQTTPIGAYLVIKRNLCIYE